MSSDDDSDEIIGTTNHLIEAIENNNTRLSRIEERQKQLHKVVDKSRVSFVLALRTTDMFATIKACQHMPKKYDSISKRYTLDYIF